MNADCRHADLSGREVKKKVEAPHEKRHGKKAGPYEHRIEQPRICWLEKNPHEIG